MEAFAQVEGVSVVALRHRLKAHARIRITPAQMRQLCDAPTPQTLLGLRDCALLHTLAGSGCRITEVVTQITTRDGGAFLQVLGKRQKGLREVPLSQEALACLQTWLAQRACHGVSPAAPLFPRFVAGGKVPTAWPLSTVSAWRAVRKYALQCGLPQIKPHDFRRFVGTGSPSGICARPSAPWATSAWTPPGRSTCSMSCSRASPRGCIERGVCGAEEFNWMSTM